MRDISATHKTAGPGYPGEAGNLLSLESHLPAFYQALRQRGQVSQDGIFLILRDLNARVEDLERAKAQNQTQGN